jgi:hypothetical protein
MDKIGDFETQDERINALNDGYILKNQHGFTVYLHKCVQKISNYNRMRRRRGKYPYSLDHPSCVVVGSISLKNRLLNKYCFLKKKLNNILKTLKEQHGRQ